MNTDKQTKKIPRFILFFCILSIFSFLTYILIHHIVSFKNTTKVDVEVYNINLSISQVQKIAKLITVKILSDDTLGSGILVCRKNQTYVVLTSKHLLIVGDSYRVVTSDCFVHKAIQVNSFNPGNNDLGLLQFQSYYDNYAIASLESPTIRVGNTVFAAGFSSEVEPSKAEEIQFTDGKIALISNQPLKTGYQIGYTNRVEQGMSGSPLLNEQGKIIGINGMDKYPLWGNPYIFKDGSVASVERQKEMRHFSWAIPIQTFKANLKDVDLNESILSNVILDRADMNGAYLLLADLSNARLRGADLKEANLKGAILENTDLEEALFCNTTMPDGQINNRDC